MEWQPIETAPKDGTKILLADNEGDIGVGSWHQEWSEAQEFVRKAKDGDVYRTVNEDFGYWDCNICCITHWMPLPPPPTDRSD